MMDEARKVTAVMKFFDVGESEAKEIIKNSELRPLRKCVLSILDDIC